MTVATDLLTRAVGEAARLLEVDGAMIYLVDESTGELRFAHDAGIRNPRARRLIRDMSLSVGVGMFGTAVARRELLVTEDYPNDDRFTHFGPADEVVELAEMRSMVVAPLLVNDQPIGAMGAYSSRTSAFSEAQVALLRALADHAAAAIGNQRLLDQLAASELHSRQQAAELERVVEVQRTLGEISRRIVDVADASEVLQQVVDAASSLLGSDGAHLTLMNDEGTDLIPMVMANRTEPETRVWLQTQRFPIGGGINGLAAQAGRAVWTDDYIGDGRIPHEPDDDSATRLELGAAAVAPLRGPGGEVIGTLAISYREPRSIDPSNVALLEELAGQGAIAVRNARLYTELRNRSEDLARFVEAQRALAEIAVQITSIRDPAVLLQRTVDEAARLLVADLALINPLTGDASLLEWAVAYAPRDHPLDDVDVTPGQGVSGLALAERRVIRTGDYLNDPAIEHTPELDEYIGRRGMHSVMSAPLDSVDAPIGTLTVQATRTHAFSEADEQLLGALAAQAAVAITNARLYEQQRESERRYRHLVDHSPDLVWSVDAEGRFTYLGESLERITGFRPDDLIGKHWAELTEPTTAHIAAAGWQAIVDNPDRDEQIRILLPVVGGGVIPAEINMIGTVVEGRFTGAHGSIRDIRERERLEEDLRRRSAELAANEERANLARELHDSVTQALFSMGLTMRAMEILLDRDPQAARGKLVELRDLQKDALAEMRNLIFELRPRGLEADGLAQALRTHAAAVQGRTGLAVSVAVDEEDRLPLDMEEALYRIAQEALHNVVKHANASAARIALKRSGRQVQLTVEDNGVGFDPTETPRGHLGLVGMRQRAEGLGGGLEVKRPPAGGTRVRATVPITPDSSAE